MVLKCVSVVPSESGIVYLCIVYINLLYVAIYGRDEVYICAEY